MKLSIVIPAYNEAARLGPTLDTIGRYVSARRLAIEAIVVDDGSRDDTASIVRRFAAGHPWVRLISNASNLGKGASVRRGILEAGGDFVLFMDADLSVPIDEVDRCLELLERDGHPIVIGSRKVPGARILIRQPILREVMGHGFTWLARLMVVYKIVDFTCGFKAFRADVARVLFSIQERPDWAFDVEVLRLAKVLDIPVHQCPVRWEHRKGSRVRFPRDIWRSLVALVEIRWRVPALVREYRASQVLFEDSRRAESDGSLGSQSL